MRYWLIPLLLLCECSGPKRLACPSACVIRIWDANYSSANTKLFSLTRDSLTITWRSGLEGGRDSVLFRRKLSDEDQARMCGYLSSHRVDTLKPEYINRDIEDGVQRVIAFKYSRIDKQIQLSNYPQKDMNELFEIVNSISGEKNYKIWY